MRINLDLDFEQKKDTQLGVRVSKRTKDRLTEIKKRYNTSYGAIIEKMVQSVEI